MRLDNKLKIAAFDTAMKSLLKNGLLPSIWGSLP